MKLSKILAVTMSGLMITINSTTTRAMLPAQYTPIPPQVSTLGVSSIVENLRRPLPEVEVSGQMSEQVAGQGNVGQDIGDLAEVYSHVKSDDQSSQVEEFNGDCGEVQWNIDPDGTMNISGSGNMTYEISTGSCWYASKEHIKNVIVGDGVRTISAEAFADCGNLESVKISDSVSHIGDNAFLGCTKLAKVKFCGKSEPSSVGISIFDGCDSLIDIKVPTDYANDSFFNKTVSKVLSEDFTYEIAKGRCYGNGSSDQSSKWILNDEGVLNITGAGRPTWALSENSYWGPYKSQIKSVIIGEGMILLDDSGAFTNCPNLQYIYLPSTVSIIFSPFASGCSKLKFIEVNPESKHYVSIDGVLYSKNMIELVRYPSGKTDESFSIPGQVDFINDKAFSRSENLKSIAPFSINIIYNRAFEYCVNLKSIKFSASSSYGSEFYGCTGLTKAEVLGYCGAVNNMFFGCTNLVSVDISASAFNIEASAFRGCSSLKSINLSYDGGRYTSVDGVIYDKNMTKIIAYPAGKTNSSFSIPDTVTEIMDNAFYNSSNLNFIDLPERLTSIGELAFYGCTSLNSIYMNQNISQIGRKAFSDCTSLSDVKFLGIREPEVIESGVFAGCDSLSSIKVPVEYQNSTFADFNVSKVLDENGTEIIVESSSREKKYIVSVIEIIFDQVVTVEEVTEAVKVMIPDQEKVEISVSVVEGNEVKVTVKSVDEETFNGFYDEIKACQNK